MAGIDSIIQALGSATEPTRVPLGDKTVRVKPPMDWRQSAMVAVRAGDFNAWALGCLVNDVKVVKHKDGSETTKGSDDPAIWIAADLTNREVLQFLTDYAEAAGTHPGK